MKTCYPVIAVIALSMGCYSASGQSVAQCKSAIPASEYNEMADAAKRKLELIEAGVDEGKYKPRYLERVSEGACAGQYVSPCARMIKGKQVDKEACSLLKSIAKSKKLKVAKPVDAPMGLVGGRSKKLEKIKTGPDAGKMKPRYYERIKSGESQGLWGSPCAHSSRSTENVDSEACADIQSLVDQF